MLFAISDAFNNLQTVSLIKDDLLTKLKNQAVLNNYISKLANANAWFAGCLGCNTENATNFKTLRKLDE